MTKITLNYAPKWVTNKSIKFDHERNWGNSSNSVPVSNVPRNSNFISSHFVYKFKYDFDGKLRVKDRIIFHGHRDAENDNFRKDCDAADMVQNLMFISFSSCLFLEKYFQTRYILQASKQAYNDSWESFAFA